MRIPHIYTESVIEIDVLIALGKEKSHHLANVLRLSPNHPITLFCGNGKSYQGHIEQMNKHEVQVIATSELNQQQESPINITLVQSLCRGEKMDWIIQKATELGVNRIIPIITERTELKLIPEKANKKREHWQAIIINASEQAKRQTIPTINLPLPLPQYLNSLASEISSPKDSESEHHPLLIMDPRQGKSLQTLSDMPNHVSILIGPEGGLSEEEVTMIRQLPHAMTINMGPRVLRTETAAIAAMTLCQGLWGDLNL